MHRPKWMVFETFLANLRETPNTRTDAKHIIAKKSGHFIQGEQPKLVTAEIRRVVNSLRESGPSMD